MVNFSLFDYYLPEKNVALKPATPRDFSKLFVYYRQTDKIVFDRFFNLDKYLPKDSFLVLNNTKVLPARIEMQKEKEGKVVVLFLVNEIEDKREEIEERREEEREEKGMIKIMVDRKVNIGEKLYFKNQEFIEIVRQDKNIFSAKFDFSLNHLFFLLEKFGEMPIPLYLRKTPLEKEKIKEKYQTIFAQKKGSAAAPTASLHFTNRVFKKIEKKGIKKYFVTLHIGLGTFAPVTEENLKMKKLHEEYYQVDKQVFQTINRLKKEGKKLVAVGTTVTRTLESLTKSKIKNQKSKIFHKTDLFIFPPYNFKMVDILLTNFHLPKSSLMMLVEAFLQFKGAKKNLVELYNIAIKNNFRFYSFGDAMLIL